MSVPKETIHRILNEDTIRGKRIRTLLREQGIPIVSVYTAIGMIIGVIVEAVAGGGDMPSKPPSPSGKSGFKEWVKKHVINLGRILANLAGKAGAALPGIIGSVVSWLLSTLGKTAVWLGNNLWAHIIAVAGLRYVTAKEWLTAREPQA